MTTILPEKETENMKMIPSESEDGVKYVLRKMPDEWRCSCPSFVYRGTCKHLTKYIVGGEFVRVR